MLLTRSTPVVVPAAGGGDCWCCCSGGGCCGGGCCCAAADELNAKVAKIAKTAKNFCCFQERSTCARSVRCALCILCGLCVPKISRRINQLHHVAEEEDRSRHDDSGRDAPCGGYGFLRRCCDSDGQRGREAAGDRRELIGRCGA